jgi:glycosyltransferase involved in cell wall biosynthesis
VNCDIVADGDSGYLATTIDEWREALTRLIADPQLCQRLGRRGRERAVSDYSLASQAPRLVALFRSVGKLA